MKRVVGVTAIAALVAAFIYIGWLNPAAVEFQYGPRHRFSVQLGWLLISAFLGGVVVAVLTGSLLQLVRSLRQWPERRHERQATRITEWERAGIALSWEGELQRARNLLLKAWRRQPRNTAAALALASSYADTSEDETARRILQQAMARDPADAELRFALGEASERLGDSAEAIRVLETVRVQHPRVPKVLLRLRELYLRTARWREAADVQDAYIHSLPSGVDTRGERARLTHLRYQAAVTLPEPAAQVEALSQVVQIDPHFLPGIVSLGDALAATGKKNEALHLWERSFRSLPHFVLIERLLTHQNTPRDRERALGLLKKRAQPSDEDGAHVIVARDALAQGDVESAAAELSAVGRPSAPAVQRLWAEVYRRRNQLEQAFEALNQATAQVTGELTGYRCVQCGRVRTDWVGFCPSCGNWDSYRSVVDLSAPQAP